MSWHFLPDVGPGTYNLGDLATDNGFTQPLLFRAMQAVATGSGTARVASPDVVSASRGLPITAPNGSQLLPYVGEQVLNQMQSLSVYVPAGCTVSIAWEY
jgi:hypothetical protein